MSKTSTTVDRLFECARIAAERRGQDIVALDVEGLTGFTDYFLLVSASSDRRVRTIAEAVRDEMKAQGLPALGVEGLKEGKWALIDFGAFVVHVFFEELRGFFDLEGLWSEAKRLPLPESVTKASAKATEVP